MTRTRRRLPHLYPTGGWLFVTWHLFGSLPSSLYPPPDKEGAGRAFLWIDRYLDTTCSGPMYLRQAAIADLVAQRLLDDAAAGRYELRAFAVMGNHVHILFRPPGDVSRVLQAVRGSTARDANKLLSRIGKPFWQRESYDRWVRDEMELQPVVAYIENNPVKAGLVANAESYRWSSAGELKPAPAS